MHFQGFVQLYYNFFLYNLPINPNVCSFIIASKLYIPQVAYIPLALQRHGKLRIRRYALLTQFVKS